MIKKYQPELRVIKFNTAPLKIIQSRGFQSIPMGAIEVEAVYTSSTSMGAIEVEVLYTRLNYLFSFDSEKSERRRFMGFL